MLMLPPGWQPASDDSVTDDVYLSVPDATWLDGPQKVDSFSVKRELVGSLLPGQVRTGSGLSVTSGDATCPSSGQAPWRRGAAKVIPGGAAQLYVQAQSGATIPLGTFRADQPAGGLLSTSVSVELLDEKLADRQINKLISPLDVTGTESPDAAWIVDRMARELGYFSTPAPVESCVLSLPVNGSRTSEVPDRYPISLDEYPVGWDTRFGTISPIASTDEYGSALTGTWGFAKPLDCDDFYAAVTFDGSAVLAFNPGQDVVDDSAAVYLYDDGTIIAANTIGSPVVGYATYTRGDDPDHPARVEVHAQRIGTPGNWTSFRARIRSAPTAPWSDWAVDTTVSTEPYSTFSSTFLSAGVSMIGLQVAADQDDAVWATPNATVYPLGNVLLAPTLPPDRDPWGGIQDVCASTLGGAFITADDQLKVRDARWMIGNRPTDATLNVLADLDNLSWTVDDTDIADRVEVSYRPPDFQRSSSTIDPEMWKADDAYKIPGRQSIQVVIDRKIAAFVWNFYPEWDTAVGPATRYSRWSARPSRDGTGSQPANEALTFSLRSVNSTRSVLTITNNTFSDLFTVNASGEPSIVLRGDVVMSQETEAVVSAGVPADVAVAPLRVDLGIHCQRQEDAERVCAFVQAQTQTANWKAGRVLVPFDWRRELGDVYQLTEPDTGLDVKVLVVGLDIEGEPGNYRQFLDLVVLSPTIYEFNTAWASANPGATIADFNTVWAGKTIADFNLDPFKTT